MWGKFCFSFVYDLGGKSLFGMLELNIAFIQRNALEICEVHCQLIRNIAFSLQKLAIKWRSSSQF